MEAAEAEASGRPRNLATRAGSCSGTCPVLKGGPFFWFSYFFFFSSLAFVASVAFVPSVASAAFAASVAFVSLPFFTCESIYRI